MNEKQITLPQLVEYFSIEMEQKLNKAAEKYGWTDEWSDPERLDGIRESLYEHLQKGDPVDVANLAMFIWWHGASTARD